MDNSSTDEISTKCCIVGGGPAGMMAGFLLARAGVEVEIIEKHGDFLRDFRGDTCHPSTLQLLDELGILTEFLKRPHQKVTQLSGQFGEQPVALADFSYLAVKAKFIALMPQWHFLNFLQEQANQYPQFSVRMNTEAVDLIENNGRICGVIAKASNGNQVRINTDLVIGADGRGSIIRQKAHLQVEDMGAPMDILWMRISREASDPPQSMGRFQAGAIFIMLNRDDYWQCGFVIPKGTIDGIKAKGIEAFRQKVAALVPYAANRVGELGSWDDIKLLTVKVDRLTKWWRDGLLCIGDAAHAMSPIGGVGINLAIQDAVAAANILYKPLLEGRCSNADLQKVQDRRNYPTRMTQRVQVFLQNHVISKALAEAEKVSLPWPLHAFNHVPLLRALPAELIGMGFRPEHIHCPDARRRKAEAVTAENL